jgi:hypothetical protein
MKMRSAIRTLRAAAIAAGALLCAGADAAIKKDEGPIPDLRPPRSSIRFEMPEKAILQGAVALAFLTLIAGRLLHRRPPPPPLVLAPIDTALTELDALPPDAGPAAIEQLSGIIRRYVREAFLTEPEGATTAELCEAYAAHPQADAESSNALEAFLCACDLERFAPGPHHEPHDLVAEARPLLALLENRRRHVNPPPLPVIT